jgi:hypothetical protein
VIGGAISAASCNWRNVRKRAAKTIGQKASLAQRVVPSVVADAVIEVASAAQDFSTGLALGGCGSRRRTSHGWVWDELTAEKAARQRHAAVGGWAGVEGRALLSSVISS